MNRLIGFLFAFVLFQTSVAQALDATPKPPKNPLSERPQPFPKITCENIEAEVSKLKGMSSAHNEALAGYMDEVITTMDKWYRQLVNYETKPLPAGELKAIKDASKDIADVQGMVWENMTTLDTRFDEVLTVLPSCLKPAAAPLQKKP